MIKISQYNTIYYLCLNAIILVRFRPKTTQRKDKKMQSLVIFLAQLMLNCCKLEETPFIYVKPGCFYNYKLLFCLWHCRARVKRNQIIFSIPVRRNW